MKTKAHQRYKLKNGVIVPGATTVINSNLGWNKNVLIDWAKRTAKEGKDPDKVRDKAAEIGTIAHYLCECDARRIEPDLKDYAPADVEIAETCFLGYLEWKKQHKIGEIYPETQLVSEQHRYGGTIDMLYKVDGKWILADIKTSKGVYAEAHIQLAAYYHLCKENGYDITDTYILHFDKKGNFATHTVKKLDTYWEIFKNCLNLHRLKKEV
jgi:hypothetical protein